MLSAYTGRRDDVADEQAPGRPPTEDLLLDHVELYVEDLDSQVSHWISRFGFTIVGTGGSPRQGFRSTVLRQGRILLVLTQGTNDAHPASAYVHRHGDGVADIALRTSDVAAVFAYAVQRGARPLSEPTPRQGPSVVATATVSGFGNVVHTLVQRDGSEPGGLPGLPDGYLPAEGGIRADADATPQEAPGLVKVDHFAVCVNIGDLDGTVEYYRDVLGFAEIFEERIVVGPQAMLSKVVQSPSGEITFTVIQPDPMADPGQIDEFLKNHDGSGVQHIAFTSGDATCSVRNLSHRGIEFLSAPAAYYELLSRRVSLRKHPVNALRELNILVDEDHGGQLFQVFTRSTHPRRTLFFEIIERLGAETFGSSNIKALYEAVELERQRENGGSW